MPIFCLFVQLKFVLDLKGKCTVYTVHQVYSMIQTVTWKSCKVDYYLVMSKSYYLSKQPL